MTISKLPGPSRVSLFLALGSRRKRRLRIRLPLGEACVQQALQKTVRGWETLINVGPGRSKVYSTVTRRCLPGLQP